MPSSEGVSSSLEACCLLTMCCLLLQLPSEMPCHCEVLSFRWRWSCHSDRSGQQGTQAADASPLSCTPHLAPFRKRRHCPAKCHATHSWLRHTPRCSGSAGRCDHAHHALSSACIRKVHPSCDVKHRLRNIGACAAAPAAAWNCLSLLATASTQCQPCIPAAPVLGWGDGARRIACSLHWGAVGDCDALCSCLIRMNLT